MRARRQIASELFSNALLTRKLYSFEKEVVDTTGHNESIFHYRLMSPTFDASANILHAYAIDRDARMVAFGTNDERIGDYVFGDNVTNGFYKLKYFGSRRGIQAYEMEQVDFFGIAAYFKASGRAVMQTGADFGCNTQSAKHQVGARCRAGLGFNWEVPTGTEDPLSLGPVMTAVPVPGTSTYAGIGIGAYLGGSVGFTVQASFPVHFEADLDISLGGAAAFVFDVPREIHLDNWSPGHPLCYEIPLEEFGIVTSIKICGVTIGVRPQVCLNFGVKDITLTLPQAVTYTRRAQLTVQKQLSFKTSGIENHPWTVNFDNTQESNLDLQGWVDPDNWKLQITPYTEAYVSLGVYAGSFATVDLDAGVRLDVPSEFSGDKQKCASPYLYGKFSPALFGMIKTDGLKVKLPIFGTITLIKEQTLAEVQLAPPAGYVWPEVCLVSQKNGGEGVAVSSAEEGVIVFKISEASSTATGVFNLYLDVLDPADEGITVKSLPFGQFSLGSIPTAVVRSLMHRHNALAYSYRFRAVPDGALAQDVLIGGVIKPNTVIGPTISGGGITLSVTALNALAYDEFREVPVSRSGFGSFPATQGRGFEYTVIQHGDKTSYQVGSDAQFFDTGSLGVLAQQTGVYKETLPARVQVRSVKALGALEPLDVALYAQAKDGTRAQLAHAVTTSELGEGAEFPALALVNGLFDPSSNDLVVSVGSGQAVIASEELEGLAANEAGAIREVTIEGIAELELVIKSESPEVAVTGLSPDVTWVITAPVFRSSLAPGSEVTVTIPASAAYGVLFLEPGVDAAALIGTENRVILTVSGLTPMVPHSWLNQHQVLCTMSSENVITVNGQKVVAVPFRVTSFDNGSSQKQTIKVESLFTGRDDCVCRPDLDVEGSFGDVFGCVERTATQGWRALADGSDQVVVPAVVEGDDWFLNRFFVPGPSGKTVAHIRQTIHEIAEGSPYKTVSNLVANLPITIKCLRATGVGLSVDSPLAWDEATKSATWTPTTELYQGFVAFGKPGAQNALFKVEGSAVKDGAAALLTLGPGGSLVDVNYDDTGVYAMPGVRKAVLADRSGDVWLYAQQATEVTVFKLGAKAGVEIEVLYETVGDVTQIRARMADGQQLPFSWWKLTTLEGVSFMAEALKITLPEDFTDSDIWADDSGLISARSVLVQSSIDGNAVDKAVFDLPASSIKSAQIKVVGGTKGVGGKDSNNNKLNTLAISLIAAGAAIVVIGVVVAVVVIALHKKRAQQDATLTLSLTNGGIAQGVME